MSSTDKTPKTTFNARVIKADQTNMFGSNRLIDLIAKGRIQKAIDLIQQGANVHFRTQIPGIIPRMIKEHYDARSTPLHIASFEGHPEIVTALLKNKADPNLKNEKSMTPVDSALLGLAHYKSKQEKLSTARIAFQRTVQRTADRISDYEAVIETLVRAGGRSCHQALPEKFRKIYLAETATPQPALKP